ncbi:SDR family oxidoreductase [Sorangium sp. So ce1078]|uniref:SDR family oxidoreductase n=1 Tax=Sorangium sp. So ce1078 TaxID=3133329 RepID=UPI003F6226EB
MNMNDDIRPLAGKKTIVIGGSRGIGAAIVKRLARDGAAVAFTYVSRPDRARELVATVESEGGRAIALQADSADASALDRAIAEGAAALGGLDVLVNNAGVLIFGNVDEYRLEDFDRMLSVNVRGVFVAAQAAARHLPRGGKILVIGSNTAERAMIAGSAVYGMTKAAVARLVRGMAWDFAHRGISVINVQPGPTTTDMNPLDGPHVDWVRNASPEKRIADPDEIARFVTYLARPESTYINGVSLTIDGGYSA